MVADEGREALGAFGYPFSEVSFFPMHIRVPGTDFQSLTSVLSSGVAFPGAPLPTLMRPKNRGSVDGWYPAVHMSVLSWMLLFWPSISHALCVPSTEIQSLAGILQCTFFLFPVRVLHFMGPLSLSLRSLAPVLSAQRFSDSGPMD